MEQVRQRKKPKQQQTAEQKRLKAYKDLQTEEWLSDVSAMLLMGISKAEIAKKYKCSISTVYNWENKIQEYRAAKVDYAKVSDIVTNDLETIDLVKQHYFELFQYENATEADKRKALEGVMQTVTLRNSIIKDSVAYQDYLKIMMYDFSKRDERRLALSNSGMLSESFRIVNCDSADLESL